MTCWPQLTQTGGIPHTRLARTPQSLTQGWHRNQALGTSIPYTRLVPVPQSLTPGWHRNQALGTSITHTRLAPVPQSLTPGWHQYLNPSHQAPTPRSLAPGSDTSIPCTRLALKHQSTVGRRTEASNPAQNCTESPKHPGNWTDSLFLASLLASLPSSLLGLGQHCLLLLLQMHCESM